jgi:hypothetical protein
MKKLFILTFLVINLIGVSQNKIGKKVKGSVSEKSSLVVAPSNYYSFSTFTASYQNITGTIVSGGKKWDDLTDTIPVGFNFKLYDDQNDTIQFAGGSYFSFNDLLNGSYLTTGSPMLEDLCDRAYDPNVDTEGDPGGISNISYTTTGLPGNKICKIEVNNAGFYGENNANGTSVSSVNFQVWLYQSSNDIEFRFGATNIQNMPVNLTNSNGFICGLFDSLDYNTSLATKANMLNGIHSGPTMVGPNANFTDVITGTVQSGRVYKFSRNAMITSISQNPHFSNIHLYPNPAKDKLFINNISQELNGSSVDFYDVTGQRIYSTRLSNEIDISSFSKGLYLVKVKTADGEVGLINKIIITN